MKAKQKEENETTHVEFRVETLDQRGDMFVLHTAETQENAMRWLSLVLEKASKDRFNLWSELIDLQHDCYNETTGKTIFPDKTKIPLAIINLVLKEYGIWIDKHEVKGECRDGN